MKTKIKYLLVLVLASFVFAGCTAMHESKQWEYKVVDLRDEGNGKMVNDQLNTLGKDGWVLVSITPYATGSRAGSYYFKRSTH